MTAVTNRYVADHELIAVYDTERDLYFVQNSNKSVDYFVWCANGNGGPDLTDTAERMITAMGMTREEVLALPPASNDDTIWNVMLKFGAVHEDYLLELKAGGDTESYPLAS